MSSFLLAKIRPAGSAKFPAFTGLFQPESGANCLSFSYGCIIELFSVERKIFLLNSLNFFILLVTERKHFLKIFTKFFSKSFCFLCTYARFFVFYAGTTASNFAGFTKGS